jgi:hypothetical protein
MEYNKEQLLKALDRPIKFPSKEESFRDLWDLLVRASSRHITTVMWKPSYCADFMDSPVDERLDKLYFYVKEELGKIGRFECRENDREKTITVSWNKLFI